MSEVLGNNHEYRDEAVILVNPNRVSMALRSVFSRMFVAYAAPFTQITVMPKHNPSNLDMPDMRDNKRPLDLSKR